MKWVRLEGRKLCVYFYELKHEEFELLLPLFLSPVLGDEDGLPDCTVLLALYVPYL